MMLFFHVPQKIKTVLLLMVIVLTVIISSFWEKSTFNKLNNSFSTIYKDRLIPANELFHINDLMHQKHRLLEKYMENPLADPQIRNTLATKTAQIDSIMHDYEQTYLVENESKVLNDFKITLEEYNALERDILSSSNPTSVDPEGQLSKLFNESHHKLTTLSKIQTTVGKELFTGSTEMSANVNLIHYLQIAIVFLVMLIVQLIILNSRSIIPRQPQNYKLN